MNCSNSFAGTERGHHAVFVTRTREFHVRRGLVVGVRHRGEPGWLAVHAALLMQVEGHIGSRAERPSPDRPGIGRRLYLLGDGHTVITSQLVAVERPSNAVVQESPRDSPGQLDAAAATITSRNRGVGREAMPSEGSQS